ncbi:MAG TPA: guanosine-3',5'-bis(diphosphate) 3'-diphosphatase [Gammaproteobacteria bacterium]|nr:guanosine-3',5'-bis(diphosphate) 3'-diphosphatase [Gammaproteobacteria bacterium]
MYQIEDLCVSLETYLPHEQVAEIYRAYHFSAEAHEGQFRATGEPYIVHPLQVAEVLSTMHMDFQSIMAAILHDVIEDTTVTKDDLANRFGEEVAELVDGVTKLTKIKFETRAERQAASFRKMMLAMVKDIRVIIVKLADRLHNMRTITALGSAQQKRIARETLDIYAPIANRLGMHQLRLELEDLGLSVLYPMRYRTLTDAVQKAGGRRQEMMQKINAALNERLKSQQIEAEVISREKHLYSLYRKMKEKRLSFSEVTDMYACRILVQEVDQCYRALGVVHNLYKPVPGKFKDYIAIPKANGYQSLHTVLFGPQGVPLEVQIRTFDMNRMADAGISAHWLYKTERQTQETSNSAQVKAREWLRNLLELQQNTVDSLEFLENVKIDLFPDEVYVFTPKGKILELPRGASAVDFAYAVHTDVGNSCVAARIDRRLAPLSTPLVNGQTVEIVTSPGARPNPAFLNFVVTSKARANIRAYLKNQKREQSIELGRRLLTKALNAQDMDLEEVPAKKLEAVLDLYHLESKQQLLQEIGLGNRIPVLVAKQLIEIDKAPTLDAAQPIPPHSHTSLGIKGTEGMVVTFAKCCHPIPGDAIQGFVSAGKGIVIHTDFCKSIADFRHRPEKWINVYWDTEVEGEFPVEVRCQVADQRGVLALLSAEIAKEDANIINVHIEERDGRWSALKFTIDVRNRIHLASIMRRLKSLAIVAKINRGKG